MGTDKTNRTLILKTHFTNQVTQRIKPLLEIKETERLWHFPFLAGLCVGLCLLVGWYFDKPQFGNLSSIGALTILYFTHSTLEKRMIHLMVVAFGMIFSFAYGLVFSFSPVSSVIALGFLAFLVYLITSYFKVPPPGNFFFIMVAAVATSMKFDIHALPEKVGVLAMGVMLSVLLAFGYSVFVAKKVVELPARRISRKKRYTKIVESAILGAVISIALAAGYLFDFESPYWIPVSALAVLQGRNLLHIAHRNLHRIFGTFIGIGLTWLIFLLNPSPLMMVVTIGLMQFIVEMLVVRNYGLAAIFITPLTILLAENAVGSQLNINELMEARLLDTVVGSVVGLAGAWFLHHENLINNVEKRIRHTEIRYRKNS